MVLLGTVREIVSMFIQFLVNVIAVRETGTDGAAAGTALDRLDVLRA
jgi:hypothetical protein